MTAALARQGLRRGVGGERRRLLLVQRLGGHRLPAAGHGALRRHQGALPLLRPMTPSRAAGSTVSPLEGGVIMQAFRL